MSSDKGRKRDKVMSKAKLDNKVPVICAVLVGIPGYLLTYFFIDWYIGLKNMGLIPLLKIFRNDWFWFIPTFVTASILAGVFAYMPKLAPRQRIFWMVIWEVLMLILLLVQCCHAYRAIDDLSVMTLRPAPRDGKRHGSKRLLRKAVKDLAKQTLLSTTAAMPYPLNAVGYLGERKLLAVIAIGIIPMFSNIGAIVFAALSRRQFKKLTEETESHIEEEKTKLTASHDSRRFVPQHALLLFVYTQIPDGSALAL